VTAANLTHSASGTDAGRATAAVGRTGDDIGAFLATVATVLRETVMRLEGTVGSITDFVLTRSRAADREVILTLQDFDRLQQEFTELSDVIAHVAATAGGGRLEDDGWTDDHGRQAIAAISVADLRNRLLRHLDGASTELVDAQTLDEVIL
jgi:hypothetical protein